MSTKSKIRDSKGAMTIYVSLVVLTMAVVLLSIYFITSTVRRNQIITVMKIKQTYEADNHNAGQIYRALAQKTEEQYAYNEDFDSQVTFSANTTTYSVNNSIITLQSTSGDPMLYMNNVTSFSPLEYRYIEVRYKTNISSSMEFFMIENPSDQTYAISQPVIGDNQWHILTIDLWSNANVKNRPTITGWRWDWSGANGATMDVDYIRIKKEQ